MFETLQRLYDDGRINDDGLQRAVDKGWIGEKEKQEIIGGKGNE